MLKDKTFRSSTLNKVANAIHVKVVRAIYKRDVQSFNKLINEDMLNTFIAAIFEQAYEKCHRLATQ